MPKQVVAQNRKGLIKKSDQEVELKKQLKINIEIDDKSLWYVLIDDGILTTTTTCKLCSITERFEKQNKTWNVKVLGCWKNMDTKNYIKF